MQETSTNLTEDEDDEAVVCAAACWSMITRMLCGAHAKIPPKTNYCSRRTSISPGMNLCSYIEFGDSADGGTHLDPNLGLAIRLCVIR